VKRMSYPIPTTKKDKLSSYIQLQF